MSNLNKLTATSSSLPNRGQIVAGLLWFATASAVPLFAKDIDIPAMFRDGCKLSISSESLIKSSSVDDSLTSFIASFPKEIKLNTVNYGARQVQLASEIVLKIRQEDEYFTIDYPSLGIYVAENSFEKAIDAFNEDFLFVLDTYAIEEDNMLTNDAKDIKKILLSLVLPKV